MPELPEVETTMSALQPFVEKKIVSVDIKNRNLRWKIEKDFENNISNKKIISITRRAKYIIFNMLDGFIILHLGMSGNIRIQDLKSNIYKKHDHIIFYLKDKKIIYNDIRRFGSIHFTHDLIDHFLIKNLGPEPLLKDFNKKYLFDISRLIIPDAPSRPRHSPRSQSHWTTRGFSFETSNVFNRRTSQASVLSVGNPYR